MVTMTHEPVLLHEPVLQERPVIGGVDTHGESHTAAALDGHGALLGVAQFPADALGYRALLAWLAGFGALQQVGVEGTGSYGAGLTRFLTGQAITVIEVDRPDRATRRRVGKSDPIDAEAAARAVLSGRATGTPKERTGQVEALRNLRIARRSAAKGRGDALRQIRSVLTTAPEPFRARFRDLPVKTLISTAASSRPDRTRAATGDLDEAVKATLRSLARRHQALTAELTDLAALIDPLVEAINPRLLRLHGVGTEVAGQLLVTCGENPDRIHTDAALAALCGASPIPASSGHTTGRHRLNRGGDRQANNALWRIAITRMATDPRTRSYVQRRTTEGLSKREIIRCLKRAIAREIWHTIQVDKP